MFTVFTVIYFQTTLLTKGVHVNQAGHLPRLSLTVPGSSKSGSFFLHDASSKEIHFRINHIR